MSNINDDTELYYARTSVILITDFVYKITLSFEFPIYFLAGQYLKLWLDKHTSRSFSIASMLTDSNKIELFISYSTDDSITFKLLKSMMKDNKIAVSIPHGDAYYRHNTTNKKIHIIVSDTGYSYGKSILLEAIKNQNHKNISFVWIIANINTMFDLDFIKEAALYKHFKYISMHENDLNSYLIKNKSKFINSDIYFATTKQIKNNLQNTICEFKIPHNIYSDSISTILLT